MFTDMGDRMTEARALWRLSRIDFDMGDYQAALAACLKSSRLFEQLNYDWGQLFVLGQLGDIYQAMNKPEQARQAWSEALHLGLGPEHPEFAAIEQRLSEQDTEGSDAGK